ncbi:bifunctional adenosylcobinamide kinase/adenosylcobinamide-phosphate guanylyltransferase [Magnetospirillum molischianum]|uniref:Bifunctional adenosylcobalamin biosynthesis protein n=1 Tax=Magnetospirillum molischianum DSM 120 TaxID=1150626 RepID=H8FPC6_MAGML|nr:bifunctional adenosylcobinamide kinase/adenosylcobinamide-phosphate guanylyltransferase [Magnetospirillum molischianum]CCG40214.1 Bifunctional adenosylcobalamin biosynthesis protein CobU [Magnetospirillum molischianum DSM 120]
MSDLIFLTGPVRSGKSARAVDVARSWGEAVAFIACYAADPNDAEMAARVSRHRAERPASWRTLEAPADVPTALAALSPRPSGVLLDSVVTWAAARFDRDDESILAEWDRLLESARAAPWPTLIVADEIGWSPVPMDADLRRFRDLCGWLGQRTGALATEAWLMVAGLPLRLK